MGKSKRTKKRTLRKSGEPKATKATPHVRVSADALPRRCLRDVKFLAEILHKTYAGKSASWDELADAAEIARQTNDTKYKFWAALAYGIIKKDDNADGQVFSLSETGRKIVAPTYDGEDREAIRKAVLTPTILSKFYSDYSRHPVPGDSHFPNVLETKFGVPRARTTEAIDIIRDNGKLAAIWVVDANGNPEIRLSAARIPGETPTDASEPVSPAEELQEEQTTDAAQQADWGKICFYITPIGEEDSENRKHADLLLKHLLEPVAAEFDLKVIRADKIERSGLITQQIFEHLAKARLCVADLSFSNANAFYELGVRHTCKRPTIQIIRKGDRIPFDLSQGRTIVIDTSDVYTIMDRFESARRELGEHMKHALSSNAESADDNPINAYLPELKVSMSG